ncbi:MAG: glycosyltransferase family A protein [Solirubrobacteraceae bacterium]|jgi:glycosyltransferase involved in cell wall biosynthesis
MTLGGSHSVSAIIPVRDGERYLCEAITSLAEQTHPPAEIIVVDDGSTDLSGSIARSCHGVRVVQTPPRGPSSARNLGAQIATQPLIAFLDADDAATPRRLELQVAELGRREHLDAVVGRMEVFVSDDCDPRLRERAHVPEGAPVAYLTGTLLIHRAAFLATGGFAENLPNAEVLDWFARARGQLAFGSVDHVILRRRIHGANRSLNQDELRAGVLMAARSGVLRATREPER